MIVKHDLYAPTLGRDVTLHLYLPDTYLHSQEQYPVLYMFDGHNLFYDEDATYGRSWRLLSHLNALPEDLIVVGIECSHEGNDRLIEYAPYPFYDMEFGGHLPAKGKQTMEFIVYTVKPYIDMHFPTLPDRNHTWIGGSSCGGLMSLYALYAWSKTFSKAIALSPYVLPSESSLFYWASHVRIKHPSSLYISWGAQEGNTGHEFIQETKVLTTLANILLRKGVKIQFDVYPFGEHCEAQWENQADTFLRFLFQ